MRVPLLSTSSPNRSRKQGSPLLVNMFLETKNTAQFSTYPPLTQDSGISPAVAYPDPGLVLFSAGNGVSVRSSIVFKNYAYIVMDSGVYKVDSSGNRTQIGSFYTTIGLVSAVASANSIVWADGVSFYRYVVSTNTFSTDGSTYGFPVGSNYLSYQDGYGFARVPETASQNGQAAFSDPASNLQTWNNADAGFFTAQSRADNLVAPFSDQRYIYMFGTETIEMFDNTGGINVFTRDLTAYHKYGCASAWSITQSKDRIYFMGTGGTGGYKACFVQNASLNIISTPQIEQQFSTYSTLSDTIAFVYEFQGHVFCNYTFPTAGETWVYDETERAWHQRTSYQPTVNVNTPYTNFRANTYMFFNGMHIIGDMHSGNLYQMTATALDEFGNKIERLITSPTIYDEGHYVALSTVECIFEPGVGLATNLTPTVSLRVSRDGGFTWGNWVAKQLGNYNKRVIWSRLGSGRSFVVQLRMTDAVGWCVLDMTAHTDAEEPDE